MNKGYDPQEIARVKEAAAKAGQPFLLNNTQEADDEEQGAYFYFVGKDGDGKEVVYDTFLYTLRSEYEMAVYELAEERLKEKFPNFTDVEAASEDELDYLDLLVDEIESEDEVAVVENVQLDEAAEYGIGLDACLNLMRVGNEEIAKFVTDFNNDTLQLDDTEYSFSYAADNGSDD
jgi:hypothetical protein